MGVDADPDNETVGGKKAAKLSKEESKCGDFEREQELTRRHDEALERKQRADLLASQRNTESDEDDGVAVGVWAKKTGSSGRKQQSRPSGRRRATRRQQSGLSSTSDSGTSDREESDSSEFATDDESESDTGSSLDESPVGDSRRKRPPARVIATRQGKVRRKAAGAPAAEPPEAPGGADRGVTSSTPEKREDSSQGQEGTLFADDARVPMEGDAPPRYFRKRADRILRDVVTTELLEGARVGQSKCIHILEHPRAADFLVGAYVRVPRRGGSFGNEFVIARITGISTPPGSEWDGGPSNFNLSFLKVAIEEAPDTVDVPIDSVGSDPFTAAEIDSFKATLRDTAMQKQQIIENLSRDLALRSFVLKSFTFSEEEVRYMLEQRRKARLSSSAARSPASGGGGDLGTLSHRDLHHRKAEAELVIEKCRQALSESSLKPQGRSEKTKRMAAAETELSQIVRALRAAEAPSTPGGAGRPSWIGASPSQAAMMTTRKSGSTVIGANSRAERVSGGRRVMWATGAHNKVGAAGSETPSSTPVAAAAPSGSATAPPPSGVPVPRAERLALLQHSIKCFKAANLRATVMPLLDQ